VLVFRAKQNKEIVLDRMVAKAIYVAEVNIIKDYQAIQRLQQNFELIVE